MRQIDIPYEIRKSNRIDYLLDLICEAVQRATYAWNSDGSKSAECQRCLEVETACKMSIVHLFTPWLPDGRIKGLTEKIPTPPKY